MGPRENPVAGLKLLRLHLEQRRAAGETRIWLKDSTLERVATLPMRARACVTPPASPPNTGQSILREEPPTGDQDKRARLAAVSGRAERCPRCRGLGTLRETMVFAVGSPDAELMFIGEAPGAEEEKQGEPFVGPAGKLLTKIIETMGLSREGVYISNIVKFRPSTGDANQGTANRKPTAQEMTASLDYVREEIAIVRPKLIVALGGTAMEGLLGLDGGVGRARGGLHDFEGTPAIVTYHPSYLLHSGAISDKRKVWEDMLLAMEQLGIPISAKQRGFFSS